VVRIQADLNRPAYVYLLMIETTGRVTPVYPWQQGSWGSRPRTDKAISKLRLPEQLTPEGELGGFEVAEGQSGMETLVLLARETPLPREVDLRRMLAGMPVQRAQSLRSVVWFSNGQVDATGLRSFKSFDPKRIDDPVLQTQARLVRQLGEHFPCIRAVSYALLGQNQD
jgi:hypothetical protein